MINSHYIPQKLHRATDWSKVKFISGLKFMKIAIHKLAYLSKILETPEIVVKTVEVASDVFSYIPILNAPLKQVKKITKGIKTSLNLLKGALSIDGFVNGKSRDWRIIALNVSGLSLFILGILSLVDKFKLINFAPIQEFIKKIPVLGAIPFTGYFNVAKIGLLTSLFLIAVNKEKTLSKKKDKLTFWETPLTKDKVLTRIQKHEQLDKRCQTKNKIEKIVAWRTLYNNFDQINPEKLEAFRRKKIDNWHAKLVQVNKERGGNGIAIAQKVIGVASILISSGSAILGVGLVAAPIISLGLGAIDALFGVVKFFLKRSVKKISLAPIEKASLHI